VLDELEKKRLVDKVWDSHIVSQRPHHPAVVYVDLHLIHEVTSPQAFAGLRERGLRVRRPERTLATMDHVTPTTPGRSEVRPGDGNANDQLALLMNNCREHGIELHQLGSATNGIIHVIAPELGRVHPGMTIVCGDSHTSTHGAFGALAWGIGTTEVEHVLATQCILQQRPESFEVRFDGQLADGVGAKDMILALIRKIGANGGSGCVLEYGGEATRALDMEGRMTLCNMSIEAGARAGMVAPDETTLAYLEGREGVPRGAQWEAAARRWLSLRPDEGAHCARSVTLDVSGLEPMITYGTHPSMSIGITEAVPQPSGEPGDRAAADSALRYMDLEPGRPLLGLPINVVFIGSCTNSRISDLRSAAAILAHRKVKPGARVLVVPGSQQVKAQAEAEGLDRVFKDAGAQWREPGCSMCIAMNGDKLEPGEYAVSTSNRNFEGRQGPGGRTFLASPLTAAACAVSGEISDPRQFGKES
jgi:3-isopropylmalate/(R)-2-methylmalate dehydratase large subunit